MHVIPCWTFWFTAIIRRRVIFPHSKLLPRHACRRRCTRAEGKRVLLLHVLGLILAQVPDCPNRLCAHQIREQRRHTKSMIAVIGLAVICTKPLHPSKLLRRNVRSRVCITPTRMRQLYCRLQNRAQFIMSGPAHQLLFLRNSLPPKMYLRDLHNH